MGELISRLIPVIDQLRRLAGDTRLWVIALLFIIFILSIERVEAYLDGPWPHQRRGDDRYNPLAPGSRSAWLAVAILLLPGMLLAVVNTVVRFSRSFPLDTLHWMGLGLVLLAWIVFVAGSANILHFGQYLRRVGLITPAALLVCLLLGDLMLLLSLLEAAR
jgi:hypothetical protein